MMMRAEVEAVQARFLLLLQARFLLLLLHHVVVSVVVASEAEARMMRAEVEAVSDVWASLYHLQQAAVPPVPPQTVST